MGILLGSRGAGRGVVASCFVSIALSFNLSMAADIVDVAVESTRDPVLAYGWHDKACVLAIPGDFYKFWGGYRTSVGVYCAEHSPAGDRIDAQLIPLPPDLDWDSVAPRNGEFRQVVASGAGQAPRFVSAVPVPRKLTFDQFLQVKQAAHQIQQFYLLREISYKFTKLQQLLEQDVNQSMKRVVDEVIKFPEELLKNAMFMDALAAVSKERLSEDAQFISRLASQVSREGLQGGKKEQK